MLKFLVLISFSLIMWVEQNNKRPKCSFKILRNVIIISNQELKSCDEILKQDPEFKGDCLSENEPTDEEYEDLYENISTPKPQAEDRFIFSAFPCPNQYKRDRRNSCKKIFTNGWTKS